MTAPGLEVDLVDFQTSMGVSLGCGCQPQMWETDTVNGPNSSEYATGNHTNGPGMGMVAESLTCWMQAHAPSTLLRGPGCYKLSRSLTTWKQRGGLGPEEKHFLETQSTLLPHTQFFLK